jgi:hypothetical protein
LLVDGPGRKIEQTRRWRRRRQSGRGAVKLSAKRIAEFDEQGYLFLPNVFSDAEVRVLMREVLRCGSDGNMT